MSKKYSLNLPTGNLNITLRNAILSFDTLLTCGARQNPKRRYLFISKVLGKYVPCRPQTMRDAYRRLAAEVLGQGLPGGVRVMGVAETATALGAGVAEEIQRAVCKNRVIYSHTSRYQLPAEVAFLIKEAHSHAPSHLIYELSPGLESDAIETLVLVDDEISTGETLSQLSAEMLARYPQLKKIIWASLANWLSPVRREALQHTHAPVELVFSSLLDGSFQFVVDTSLVSGLPDKTANSVCIMDTYSDQARTGYRVSDLPEKVFFQRINPATQQAEKLDVTSLNPQEKYTLIGTGEFTYLPFLFAEHLEQGGLDVVVQSTGRSPILEGQSIQRKEAFFDPAHDGLFYLYNRDTERIPIIFYETQAQYENCRLRSQIGATAGILCQPEQGAV